MAKRKKEPPRFEGTLSEGQSLTIFVKGFTLQARVVPDEDMGPPWIEHDGHGIVSDWVRRPKRPGELLLCESGGHARYYDMQSSMDKAEREGWDAPPYNKGTKREQAARACAADYEHLKAWCDNEWRWVGVVIDVSKDAIPIEDYAAALWGIGSDSGDYLTQVANGLIEEAVGVADVKCRMMIDKLSK